MQVRQKQTADRADGNSNLSQAQCGAAPAVKQQPYPAGLDQSAGAVLLEIHQRPSSASQQHDSEAVRRYGATAAPGLTRALCIEAAGKTADRNDETQRVQHERWSSGLVPGSPTNERRSARRPAIASDEPPPCRRRTQRETVPRGNAPLSG